MSIKRRIFCILFSLLTFKSHSLTWQDLWKSKNQQGQIMMEKHDFIGAKNTFSDVEWQAVAAYRAQDYQAAVNLFQQSKSSDANYNLGNALAKLGKYKEAIAAYDKVLNTNKDHADAKYNKELIEKLLQQQNQNNQQKKQNDQENNKQQNSMNSNNKNQQSKSQDKSKAQDSLQNTKSANPEDKQEATKQKQNLSPKSTKNKQNSKPSKDGNQQMQAQWLKLIPDDPGGLLREKFKRDYLRRRGELSQ